MSFTIHCPNCSLGLTASAEDAGKQGKCSGCGTVFTIEMPYAKAAVPSGMPMWTDTTPGVIRLGDGLSRGFTLLHANLGTFVLIGLCSFAIDVGLFLAGNLPCLGILLGLANGFVLTPAFRCGLFRASLRQHDGLQAEVGDLFGEFDQISDYILLTLVYLAFSFAVFIPTGVVVLIGFIPMFQGQPQPNIPVLVASGIIFLVSVLFLIMALAFALPALQDRRAGFWDAIQTSWQLMASNPMGTLGMILLAGLLRLLGGALCGVGLIYTIPAIHAMTAGVYRTAVPPRARAQPAALIAAPPWPGPPPPAATPAVVPPSPPPRDD